MGEHQTLFTIIVKTRLYDNDDWDEKTVTWESLNATASVMSTKFTVDASKINSGVAANATELLREGGGYDGYGIVTLKLKILPTTGKNGSSNWVQFGSRSSDNVSFLSHLDDASFFIHS